MHPRKAYTDEKLYAELRQKLLRRGFDEDELAAVRDCLNELRVARRKVDELRTERNARSKKIGALQKTSPEEAEKEKGRVLQLKVLLEEAENNARQTEERAWQLEMRVPNVPLDETPEGSTEDDNVVARTEGEYRSPATKPPPHWEIADRMRLLDLERASKVTGSMYAIARGDLARLLRALVNFAFAENRNNYLEMVVPTFVNTESFTATGHLPKFESESYKIENDPLWVIPTGEVPLTALHRDERLDEDQLPLRYMTYTSCFRREAGAAGKNTRGLQRLHEFHKVEFVKLCSEKNVDEEYRSMLADAENTLQKLELPYRVLDLCAGDLTFSSSRVFDLEVYSPGVDDWLEVSSVGYFGQFQARRGNVRYRRADTGDLDHVYFLNGSAVATPRVLAALLEHGYEEQHNRVRIPAALVPHFGAEYLEKTWR